MEESNKEKRERAVVNRWAKANREQLIREFGQSGFEKLLNLTKVSLNKRGRKPAKSEFPYIYRTDELFELWQQPDDDIIKPDDGCWSYSRSRQDLSDLIAAEDILDALKDAENDRYRDCILSVSVESAADLANLIRACIELEWMSGKNEDIKTYYKAYFALFPNTKEKFTYKAYHDALEFIDEATVKGIKSELLNAYASTPNSLLVEFVNDQLDEYANELYYDVFPDY